jgi:hypothetical protein
VGITHVAQFSRVRKQWWLTEPTGSLCPWHIYTWSSGMTWRHTHTHTHTLRGQAKRSRKNQWPLIQTASWTVSTSIVTRLSDTSLLRPWQHLLKQLFSNQPKHWVFCSRKEESLVVSSKTPCIWCSAVRASAVPLSWFCFFLETLPTQFHAFQFPISLALSR